MIRRNAIKVIKALMSAQLCCSLISFSAQCQNASVRFENIASEQGLADINISSIIQDANGFIWIGSEDGLTKYDGYKCTVYRHQNNNPNSISDNEIYALCIDGNGELWAGTRNGLNRYDSRYDGFENFFHDSADAHSLSSNEIFALAKDPSGNLWVGTYGGGLDLLKVNNNYSGSHFIHHRKSDSDANTISDNRIYSICFDSSGYALIGTDSGLNLMDAGGGNFVRFFQDHSNPATISNNTIYKISASRDGTFWLTGKGMLDNAVLNTHGKKPQIIVEHFLPKLIGKKSPNQWAISDFIIDQDNIAWVATNDLGLLRFKFSRDAKKISYDKFSGKGNALYELNTQIIIKIYEDVSGVLWIGTGKGISKYMPSKNRFNALQLNSNILNKGERSIMSLQCDDKNNLWVGVDSDSMFIINKLPDENSFSSLQIGDNGSSGFDQVNILFKTHTGDICIGTFLQGLFIIPYSTAINNKRNWIHISSENFKKLPSNNIYYITEDKNGLLWIGTYMGVCTYNPQTRELTPIYVSPSGNVLSSYIIRTILEDDENNIWCGSDDGLYVIKNGNIVKTFRTKANDPASISNNRITASYIDSRNNLWIGTKGGLNLFDKAANKFIRFTSLQGLPNDGIRSIKEDSKGNLWIGTNNGLIKMNIESKEIEHYNVEDGLISETFEMNAAASDANGFLYFGTNNGLVSFHPDSIKKNLFIPPVVITGVKILDQPLTSFSDTALVNTYLRDKKLVLHYDQNFFSFEFAALNYINSAANKYTYILEGVDKQWHAQSTQRFANYTDIKPGSYTFKVKGSNNDGIWNETPVIIQVIITPPWWQTWWFYTLCFIAACSLVYFIYRIRIKQILKLYNLRSGIAKDLHDDVGSALSSIAMLSNIAQEGKTKSRLQPEEIFSRIGDTSKRMIDLMDDIVWSVNPDNDRFSNMLIRMREYAAEMLEAKNIEYSFHVSKEIDEQKIPMQIRKDYFLIFKESVNNLAKYSAATEARIAIEKIKNQIITTITDNGKGFDAQLLNSGNGLKNMQQRAASIKGNVQIQTAPGKGTAVILSIPAA